MEAVLKAFPRFNLFGLFGNKTTPKKNDMNYDKNECQTRMFRSSDDNISTFKRGDRSLSLHDLNTDFISSKGNEFYWNFFDGMYVDYSVIEWAGDNIDIDNLAYGEVNIDCLEKVFLRLTARARLFGDVALSTVIDKMPGVDIDKVSAQLYGATSEFIDKYYIDESMICGSKAPVGTDMKDSIRVVTLKNMEDIACSLKFVFAASERNEYKTVDSSVTLSSVFVVSDVDSIRVFGDSEQLFDIEPSDVVTFKGSSITVNKDGYNHTITIR